MTLDNNCSVNQLAVTTFYMSVQFQSILPITIFDSYRCILTFKGPNFVVRLRWHIIVVRPNLITCHDVFHLSRLSSIKHFPHLPEPFHTSSLLIFVRFCDAQIQYKRFVTCKIEQIACAFKTKVLPIWWYVIHLSSSSIFQTFHQLTPDWN